MNSSFFSPSYEVARQRFCDLTSAAGGTLDALALDATAPSGESLGIDIAWLGEKTPRQAIIHVCGIHGIEGFAGSAIQLAALQSRLPIPANTALIFVHVLNPFGMAWLRRCNSNNVDLNRNFYFGENGRQGAPTGYAALDSFLNPARPPSIDMFHLRLLLTQACLGERAIRQAVASGQHTHPRGLFFGGHGLEKEPATYRQWLQARLQGAERLFVIDLHTGLGNFGQASLFCRSAAGEKAEIGSALGVPIASEDEETGVMGYEFDGGHCEVYRSALPHVKVDFLTQEFGTWSGRRLLRILRAENQHHHFGGGTLDHWTKRGIKEAFCPASPLWRRTVVDNGLLLLRNVSVFIDKAQSAEPSATLHH